MRTLFSKVSKNKNQDPETNNEVHNKEDNNDNHQTSQDIVSLGSKIKILAVLMIVGFSAYVAYWVQDPGEIKTDVLNNDQTQNATAPSSSENMAATAAQNSTQEISIVNFAFDPSTIKVSKGTTVTWVNKDAVPHNIVGENFSSGILNPGQSFSYTFEEEGSFDYVCSLHPQMKGSLMVSAIQTLQSNAVNAPSETSQENTASGNNAANEQTPSVQNNASDLHGAAVPGNEKSEDETTLVATIESVENDPTVNTTETLSDTENTSDLLAQDNSEENIYQTSAPAPEVPGLEQVESTTESSETPKVKVANAEEADKLANSGPEDYLYVAMLGIILYFNRKKLGQVLMKK